MMDNPKNDMRSDNMSQDTGESKRSAYLILLGLSTVSALAILSIWLTVRSGPGDMGGPALFIIGIQWLLVIPATLIVFFVYSGLSRLSLKLWYEIKPWVRIGLPLLLNILAASSFFIYNFIPSWYDNTSGFLLSRNLTLTIKEESIMPSVSKFDGPTYHAILHAENNTGQEISLYFSIGDYRTELYQEDNWEYLLGSGHSMRIPPGDSDFAINVQIDYTEVFCSNDILAKPIHLLYSLQDSNQDQGGFSLGKTINQRLQELACDVP